MHIVPVLAALLGVRSAFSALDSNSTLDSLVNPTPFFALYVTGSVIQIYNPLCVPVDLQSLAIERVTGE